MNFDLKDLKVFLAILETGSMSGASRRTNTSVSAVHERMKLLEARAGIPLLNSDVRGSRPSKAGLTLAKHAMIVLLDAERLSGAIDSLKSKESGVISVRANSSALASSFPEILARFLARYPDVIIDLREELSHDIANAVREGNADFGIAEENTNLEGLKTERFLSERLVILLPPGHRLQNRNTVSFEQISEESFIGLDEHSAIHTYLLKQENITGKALTTRIRLRSFDGVCRMVAAGAGVAIVPSAAIPSSAIESGARAIAISDKWSIRNLVICQSPNRPHSTLIQGLVDRLTNQTELSE